MRFVTASTLAAFVLLSPCELLALDLAPNGGQERLVRTLRQVAAPEPPADDGQPSPQEICATLAQAATANDLPVIFFLRLIWHESRFDPFAISRAGALGVAQFMPKVARAIGLSDPFDPAEALPASARFLRDLHEKFGNLGLAAAAYNAGTRRIREWLDRRGRLPQETRDYVVKVTGRSPEDWAKAALGEIALAMPPAPCRAPQSLTVPGGTAPMPAPRPRLLEAAAAPDVSAAAKTHRHKAKASLARKRPAIAAAARGRARAHARAHAHAHAARRR
jgi:hypothetical protein